MEIIIKILSWIACITFAFFALVLGIVMFIDGIDALRGKNKPIDLPDFLQRFFRESDSTK
jgi:hypothetical protein